MPSHALPMILLCIGLTFVLLSQIVECIIDYMETPEEDEDENK